MNLTRLLDVLIYIENHVSDKNLILNYQNLSSLLFKYSDTRAEELLKQIEENKRTILGIHSEFKSKNWSESQNASIQKLNKDKVLGKSAIVRLNQLFSKNIENPFELAKQIDLIVKDLNHLLNEVSILMKSLDPLVKTSDEKVFDEFNDEDNLLIISFTDGTFFQNINLLEKFCRIWNKVLMSFMYLTKETLKPAQIYEIKTNSITFLLDPETISALTKGSYEVLKGYKKVLEIRKLQLEINNLNLSNKIEIESLLEDEVINIVDIISSQVTYELSANYNWDGKPKKNEIHKNVQVALKQIVNFIEKGGKVESVQSKELHDLNEKIIIILNNIKELENSNQTDEKFHIDISFDDEEEVEKFE